MRSAAADARSARSTRPALGCDVSRPGVASSVLLPAPLAPHQTRGPMPGSKLEVDATHDRRGARTGARDPARISTGAGPAAEAAAAALTGSSAGRSRPPLP